MSMPFKSVLNYIRTFFTVPPLEGDRKRRAATSDYDSPTKIRRYSPYVSAKSPTRIIPIQRENDDMSSWLPLKTEPRKQSPLTKTLRTPMKSLRLEDVIVVDDPEEDIEIKAPSSRGRIRTFTSTPFHKNSNDFENGNDDVILVRHTRSPKETEMACKLTGLNYMKSKAQVDRPLFTIGRGANHRETKKDRLKHLSPSRNDSPGYSFQDYSFRLEDKMQYKKLLDQARTDDSSVYHTPVASLFDSYEFSNGGDKTANSPLDKFKKSKEKPRETTKERIIKVLDDLEGNDAVVVKDSDSDDSVVLINPPSPKPDIKVDRVNSLKPLVDSLATSKRSWLDRLVENHKQYVENRQREIDNLRECSQQAEEINKDINIELLRRKVNDCLQLRDVILPEIEVVPKVQLPELTDEHLQMVQRAFRGDPNEVLARKFNLNITRRDLMTLAGLNWLNDEVINFYMNLIMERGTDSKWPKSYAFNTFFYPKLIKDGPQSLRRWTKRVDLFSYDFICVPVHLGMHWCMAIINLKDKTIRYYDSMGSPNNKCLAALRHYLEAEHMDKKNSQFDTSGFVLENMENIPQQMNGSDCGMFSCTFAEFITRNGDISFKQEDMPYLRKKMVVEIMSGELLIK